MNGMSDLAHAVDQVFRAGGILVRDFSMDYREQQHRYAMSVAEWLDGKTVAVSMLEGETGIGKSLAYLLPVAIHIAMKPGKCRCLISTYTVHLMHQLKSDANVINRVLDALDLRPVTIVTRLGRSQYVSAGRVLSLAERTADARCKERLLGWYDLVTRRYGEHVYTKYGTGPESLSAIESLESSVSLTEHCSREDARWYLSDCEAATKADIVLTSHTVTMLFARGVSIFGSDASMPFTHVVADEADRIADAAESIFRLRSSPTRIARIITEIGNTQNWKKADIKAACQALTELQVVLDELGLLYHEKTCVLTKELPLNAGARFHAVAEMARVRLKPLAKSISADNEVQYEKLTAIIGLYKSIKKTLGDKSRASCIAWSPVHRKGSIATDNPFAALNFSTYLRGIGDYQPPVSVLLTSGTLAVSGKHGRERFTPIRSTLGIKDPDVKFVGQFAPGDYGRIAFVLAGAVAKPFYACRDGEDAPYNPDWLGYTARMLAACTDQGATLCLCPSFLEVEELRSLLEHRHDIGFHQAGTRLDVLIRQLQAGDIRSIVTPSAWEGVSIRGPGGAQLLKNIMVTRIPVQPPSAVMESTFIAGYLEQGRSRQMAIRVLYSRVRERALRKFKQGLIGRGIRDSGDCITAYCADPRIGPGRQHNLTGVIPERFMHSFTHAAYFESEACSPPPRRVQEIVAWL
ncbi:hypothetical protein GCM10023116_08720 [Kistimonas scapharcae]|uniref:Helicase ATP-binding domain-containing protein n=2 Tax=Kistimonas scapharcae TaxID=1036133 RepID=A0ABP8UXE1_9GAMM